jgi:hypothetical protein
MKPAILALTLLLSSCYAMTSIPEVKQSEGPHYSIVWPWDSRVVYAKGEKVTMPEFYDNGPIFQSLQDNNLDIQPPGYCTSDTSIFAPAGSQLPYIIPDINWQSYWKRIR